MEVTGERALYDIETYKGLFEGVSKHIAVASLLGKAQRRYITEKHCGFLPVTERPIELPPPCKREAK